MPIRPKISSPLPPSQKTFPNWWELMEALEGEINANYDLWKLLAEGKPPSNAVIDQYLQHVNKPIPKGKLPRLWNDEQTGGSLAYFFAPNGKGGYYAYKDYYVKEKNSKSEPASGGAPQMASDRNTNGVPVPEGPVPTGLVLEPAPEPEPESESEPTPSDTNQSGRNRDALNTDRKLQAAGGQARAASQQAQAAKTAAAAAAKAASAAAGTPAEAQAQAAADAAAEEAKQASDVSGAADAHLEEVREKAKEEAETTPAPPNPPDVPEGRFIVEPVYKETSSYAFSTEQENVVSQYSPYWVLIVVPFKTKLTASQAKINDLVDDVSKADISANGVSTIEKAEESGGIIDLSNYCTSWRISHSKSSYVMNGSFTLVRPDVIDSKGQSAGVDSYGTINGVVENTALQSIKTQDWVMFWAMDNETDFERIRAAAVNGSGANAIVNDKESGLKFVGKVKSFKTTQTIASNGVIMRKYFIDAQAFSEFDNTIYYSQWAEVSDTILSSKLGTLLQAFVLTPSGGLQVNTTQETIPFFTNLLFDMTLRDSLAQGTVDNGTALDSFLATQAPNGPCIIPAKVYELLNHGKEKKIPPRQETVVTGDVTGGQTIFYWPLGRTGFTVSSRFGTRDDPNERARIKMHDGIDISCPVGTAVYPSSDGVVESIEDKPKGYGNVITIKHYDGYTTRYAHLSKIEQGIVKGIRVAAGTKIGESGGAAGAPGSGNSTGPHLHFEIRKNGIAEDPQLQTYVISQIRHSFNLPVYIPPKSTAPVAAPAAAQTEPRTSKIYTYVDILYQYIGILTKNVLNDYQTKTPQHYYQQPSEITTSVGNGYPLNYTNTYKVGKEMDSPLLVQTIHFDSRSIWQILKTYLNEPVNEIFTSIRMNHEGRIFPTFICRQTPFSTTSFKNAHKDKYKITQYVDIPKWYVPMSNVLTYDVGYSDGLTVNYVRLKLQSTVGEGTASEVNYQVNVPPAIDSADIMRNGLRMYNVVSTSGIGNVEEAQEQGQFWTKLIADFVFRLKYQVNGNITCKGIQKPVSIGDNVIVNDVMFHIEGMTHEGAIDMSGKKRFNTTMSLTHGESLQSLGVKNGSVEIANPNI